MSYDIFFWREQRGARIDPEQVLSELQDTVEFPGIISLPLNTVRQAFLREFPDITDDGSSLDWKGDGSYFQVSFTFLDERTVSLTYSLLRLRVAQVFTRDAAPR